MHGIWFLNRPFFLFPLILDEVRQHRDRGFSPGFVWIPNSPGFAWLTQALEDERILGLLL